MRFDLRLAMVLLVGCVTVPKPEAPPTPKPVEPMSVPAQPGETHFANLRRYTFGGENAEAYWAFDGKSLSLQARGPSDGCDRIYTLQLSPLQTTLRSSGEGATTCAHYFPGNAEILYASTHLGAAACPPKPDMSLGYVWPLYETYDIFKTSLADTKRVTRLTDTPGYDAEGTVCSVDGSIIFTSVRDGDLELYRMDKDGKNVKRLTFTKGYDGGAFFNKDCTKIVWRASRPKAGKELEDYERLLSQHLVRPTKLELYVANADGSDARQVTYLNAASFAPFWFPNEPRVLFASNVGDPKGRNFDLWAINADGTNLERITTAKGFDGFPMFSPDGTKLAFSSNRLTAEGKTDTDLYITDWVSHPAPKTDGPAERIRDSVQTLADPSMDGRGVANGGAEKAGGWLENRFKELLLSAMGEDNSFRNGFEVPLSVQRTDKTSLTVENSAVDAKDFTPMGFSGQASVSGNAVLAGYGVVDEALGLDDFKGLEVKGKIVVVRRFAPTHPKLVTPEQQRQAGDLRRKAFNARAKGATALLVVDQPIVEGKDVPSEAALPSLSPEGSGDSGLPVVVVKRAALAKVWSKLEAKKPVKVSVTVGLSTKRAPAFNVIGRLAATTTPVGGAIIVGAHYDHLGFGGRNSLAPGKSEPHLGADDNASGVATMLEIARSVAAEPNRNRDVIFIAFSGEEDGVLGSSALVASKPAWLTNAWAMINLDMVGRVRSNHVAVLGSKSAEQWPALIDAACAEARLACDASGDGYGPSDHMPFYSAGLPVLHFFSGAHDDYHKPSDASDKVNPAGAAAVARAVTSLIAHAPTTPLTYVKVSAPVGQGDARSFNASLGTVPNYGGPKDGVAGVLLDDVRPEGAAAKAGLTRGDVITRIGANEIRSVEDLMFVLMQAKPGQTVELQFLRDGKAQKVDVTFQEGRRR